MERQNGNSTAVYELRAGGETRGIEHNSRMRRISLRPSSTGIVTKPPVTMREKLKVA